MVVVALKIHAGRIPHIFLISPFMRKTIANLLHDDKRGSHKGAQLVNYSILGLIILSVVLIVLEVDPKYEAVKGFFYAADVVIVLLFTVEFALRVWTIALIAPEYKGFSGRVKYLFSFYGFIDMVALVSFYAAFFFSGPAASFLKSLRVIRIIRLAQHMKSFDFIVRATRNKRFELMISMQLVLLLTFILAVLLFHVENHAQPQKFSSVWSSMLWAFSKFIGDIGGYGDFKPITPVGMVLATCVGILSVAIFAVPAGIIASGFVEEIESEKRNKELNERISLLEASFSPVKNATLGTMVPKRKRTLPSLQARLNYTDNEIFEAVRSCNRLRLKWEKSDPSLKMEDMIVLEHFIPNTMYGVKRLASESRIFVINPIGKGERSISHFTNALSAYGKYNFISNEVFSGGEIIKDNKFRIDVNPKYMEDTFEAPEGAQVFLEDVQHEIKPEDWVFVFRSSAGHRAIDVHTLFGGKKGQHTIEEVEHPTVNDPKELKKIVDALREGTKALGYTFGTHEEFGNTSGNSLHQYIRKKTGANVLTLFLSIELISEADRIYYPFLKELADRIAAVERS
jgi:voltage-gated potassium channel